MSDEVMNIIWENINSSMINLIHYKYNMQTQKSYLGVKFTSGSSYIYSDVRMSDIFILLKSDSVGKAFVESIKDRYPYKNIGVVNSGSPLSQLED